MKHEQAEEIIELLHEILHKIGGHEPTQAKLPALTEGAVIPLEDRPRAKRYPHREDEGTIFRSRPGYNWVCPYCNKAILAGDMIIAFEPKPGARTTYAHLSCDEEEKKRWA